MRPVESATEACVCAYTGCRHLRVFVSAWALARADLHACAAMLSVWLALGERARACVRGPQRECCQAKGAQGRSELV